MTFKKWLRKIALFPLSIIMGNTDGYSADALAEIAATDTGDGPSLGERVMAFAGDPNAQFQVVKEPDAAASEDDDSDADQSGNQGDEDDEGLDTPSEEDDLDADQDEDADADESNDQDADKSEEGKGTKKRTLEERAAEIAQKIVEQELAKRDKSSAADVPDFAPADVVAKVKLNIVRQQAKIRELQSDIDMEGDDVDPAVVDQLLALEEFVSEAKAALKDNAEKQKAWEAKQAAKKNVTDNGDAIRAELDSAAEMYRTEMKIEPATWNKMGQWFESQIAIKPLIGEEFNDIFSRQGKVAAIRFAHEYTVKNMGQTVKKATEKKEQSKNQTAKLTASTTGKAAPMDIKKIQAEFAANPSDENFVRLQAAKRQARAA